MRSLPAIIICLTCAASTAAQEEQYSRFIAESAPLTPAEQLQKFHLPSGFQIELVAAEPDIRKPINLNFDAAGRLLVTCSVEYPFGAQNEKTARDTIKRLADTNGDGHYDKVELLASQLNIPVGITPSPNGLIAFSIPEIQSFPANADPRTLFGSFDSADTHGMPSSFTWWIDGWIYGCQGESNNSTVKLPGGKEVVLNGGATFRFRPDGSDFEKFAHGQVNPFGLTFDSLGNLYSADSHSRPAYLLLRDARYPGLTTTDDGLGYGPPMMQHRHGSTGIAGIACYEAEQFPTEYRGNLFIGNPVTGRINRDKLAPSFLKKGHGSTVEAVEQPDFLTCDDPWFRPVDIQLGPDGALYVADFYNRIIAHSLVPLGHARRDRERGRIWRISYGEGKAKASVPDLTQADVNQLIRRLDDPNLLVRTHATHQLVERIGRPCVPHLTSLIQNQSTPRQRVHALWALHRLDLLDDKLIEKLAADTDRNVRVHLLKALAEESGDTPVRAELARMHLRDSDSFVRRAAAELLRRHAAAENVSPLLALWGKTPTEDELLIHTIRLTLRANLSNPDVFAAATRNLDVQSDEGAKLADVCLGLQSSAAAAFLLDYVKANGVKAPRMPDFLQHAARHVDADSLPDVYTYSLSFRDRGDAHERRVLRSVYRAVEARGVKLPPEISEWAAATAGKLVGSKDEAEQFTGIELAWDLKLKSLSGELARLAAKDSPQQPLRSFAIDALAAVDAAGAYDVLGTIQSDVAEPLLIRQKAADSLGKINSDGSRALLVTQLPLAPAPLATTIAQQLALSPKGATLLLDAVKTGAASPQLLQDSVVDLRLRTFRMPAIDESLSKLTANLRPAENETARLIFRRRSAFARAETDAAAGRTLFMKHCSACHQLGDEGKKVGPNLDGIGLRGVDRLLEDLLDPNRNVANAFRRSTVTLKNGRVHNGLIISDEGNTLTLVDEEGKPQRIARDEIDARRLSPLSPMPGNVAEKVPEAEFYHLLAFLLQQREKPTPPQ